MPSPVRCPLPRPTSVHAAAAAGTEGDLPSRTAIGTAQVIGGGLALLTVVGPMMANADSGTRLALAMMHVALGVAVVLSLEAILRWAKARRAQ